MGDSFSEDKNFFWRRFVFLTSIFFIGFSVPLHGQALFINEVLASNLTGITDEDGDTSDWIELFNAGRDSIDLSGYTLTDERDEPDQWIFPSVIINPNTYLLIWVSGKDRQVPSALHTNFKLDASGEYVGLFAPDKSKIDGITFGSQRADISYGRFPDGSDHFTTFQNPTPGSPNQEEITLYFSHSEGVYQNDISVVLQTNIGTGDIYYTLDGSEPDPGDYLYSAAITISVPVVIRARVFDNETPLTNIETRNYIVNDDPKLPVLSISTNPEYLWDSSIGIHTNYDSTGINWERPVHLTLIEDGETQFSLPAGIRIHGGFSRSLAKKNFRLYFRSEYGESELNYPLFDGRSYTKYKRFVLYAPSCDQVTADLNTFTLIADALLHSLWFSEDGIVSLFRPVSLYLNGAYWGMYWIREYIDRYYVESNFGFTEIDLNRILKGQIYPGVREGDADYWLETYYFFENNSLSSNDIYNIVKTRYFDIDNFTDYHIFCIYAATLDWPHNNVDRFRDRIGNDPRWRFLLWDHNYAWRRAYPWHETLKWATRNKVCPDIDSGDYSELLTSTVILRGMLKNMNYRYSFINRFADLLNTVFLPDNIDAHITLLENAIRPEMVRELQRWGNGMDIGAWNYAIKNIRLFVRQRPKYMKKQILNKFYLSDTVKVTISPCIGEGTVTLNSITPVNLPWEGIYFQNVPIQIKATPASGCVFCHWADTTLPNIPEITMTPTRDLEIQAIFQEKLSINNIQVTTITDTSSIIEWQTNRPALAQVEYGPDTTYGYQSISNCEPLLEHTVGLINLQPEIMYHFRVINWSIYGDSAISEDHIFQTESYFRFDEIRVDSVTCSEALISWTMNRPSFGCISYGIDSTLSTIQNDTAYGCHHEIFLMNLNDSSVYYFRVESSDSLDHFTQSSILSFTTLSGSTDLYDDENYCQDVPNLFSISQNYPNPFNHGTHVDLEIPESGRMKAVVFNLTGQEVFNLYEGDISPGIKRITWDGTGFSGEMLVSGVYVLKVVFEGESGKKERGTARLVMIR